MPNTNHRKLTDQQVEEIVQLYQDFTQREIADAYGVSVTTINLIINRRAVVNRLREIDQEAVDNFSVAVTGSRSLGIL